MKLEIFQPTIIQKHVLQNLMELYQYDFSEFESADVNENGLYGYKYLDYYWTIPTHLPFLIEVDGNLAGFALVREIASEDSSCSSYLKICEFFIMKKYRKEGIGKQAAFHIFDLFQGVWEVAELETNLPAQKFWRKTISEYTNNEYVEIKRDHWPGPIQRFVSAKYLPLQSLTLLL
ncbi:GNAT family N-acetyltransferase [Planococcus maritimus]|uniref:GNAT family N-acetyltransferase n=1 Tax=Planococcus maritimus TaxID=192421 RepID=UPI0023312979|nr:GNAT family N-acetyltransferase [Planococcus maritimus]